MLGAVVKLLFFALIVNPGIINYLSLHLLSTSIREEAIDATHQFRIVTRF